MSEKLESQLDLKSQNALIKVLSSLIDENEKLALANQEVCFDHTSVQLLSNQIEAQQVRLDAIVASNRKLEEEISKAQKMFQDKIDSMQPFYQKALQNKSELQLSRETKVRQLYDTVEALKTEEKILDDEIEKLTNESTIHRNTNLVHQINKTPVAIETDRIILETENMLDELSAQMSYFSKVSDFNSAVFLTKNHPDPDTENLVE